MLAAALAVVLGGCGITYFHPPAAHSSSSSSASCQSRVRQEDPSLTAAQVNQICSGGGPSAPSQPAPAVTCTLGATGADVQVQITNSVPCGQEIQVLASIGLSWYPVSALATPGAAGTADGETMFRVCQLGKNGSVMTVMDAGAGSYGQQICSTEEQDGWEPS